MSAPFLLGLWLTFLAALLASGHCIGMCGGLVATYSLKLNKEGRSLFGPHLLYGVGRVATYVLLGGLSAWFGSVTMTFGRPQSLEGVPHLLAGLIMIWMGLDTLGLIPFFKRAAKQEKGFFVRMIQRLLHSQSRFGSLFLGVLTGLLPCTLHWAFQAEALASGSVERGMAILLAFGLGTLPCHVGIWFGFSMARSQSPQTPVASGRSAHYCDGNDGIKKSLGRWSGAGVLLMGLWMRSL